MHVTVVNTFTEDETLLKTSITCSLGQLLRWYYLISGLLATAAQNMTFSHWPHSTLDHFPSPSQVMTGHVLLCGPQTDISYIPMCSWSGDKSKSSHVRGADRDSHPAGHS